MEPPWNTQDVKTNVVSNVCNSIKYGTNVGSRKKRCSQHSIVLNDLNYIVVILVKYIARSIVMGFQFDICRLFTNLCSFCRFGNASLIFVDWFQPHDSSWKTFPEIEWYLVLRSFCIRDSNSKLEGLKHYELSFG